MKHCPRCQHTYSDTQRFCVDDGELLSLRDPYHLVGRTLVDKYRIDALIGVGGMGAVYSAHHLGLDRRVAFKILLPHLTFGNPELISLFEREAKTAGRLLHENIVSIFDAGRTNDDIAYIAMEWLDGCTLEDELAAQGPLGFERAAGILRQVAAALEEAHAHRIIHRDLKPSNVMLIKRTDGRERVKVLDFGISKVLSATGGSPVSSVMGTPHYASPEQFQVGVNIDGRADIYSLGIMLYEILTGMIPFSATSVPELIRLQMTAAPPPLRQLRSDAPAAVEQLVNRLLAKDPDQRPQHVSKIPALFDQALSRPAQPQTETMMEEELPVTPEPPRAEKCESPSTPSAVNPTPHLEKVPQPAAAAEGRAINRSVNSTPRLEKAPPEINLAVADVHVPVGNEFKETRRVQEVVTLPEFGPGVAPDAITRPATRWASLFLDWRYITGGIVLLVAVSILLWLIFRGTLLPTKPRPSAQIPSPPVAPTPDPKPSLSVPSPTQPNPTSEDRKVKPKSNPKQDNKDARKPNKAIEEIEKIGKEGEEPT